MSEKIFSLASWITTLIFLALFLSQCQKNSNLQENIVVIEEWQNNTNLLIQNQYAKNRTLTTSDRKNVLEIKNLTGEKKALQQLIEREKRTNTALRSTIRAQIQSTTTDVTVEYNEVGNKQVSFGANTPANGWPTYKFVDDNDWYKIHGTVNADSATVLLETWAALEYTFTYEKDGSLFSLKEPVVKATIDNPYIVWESVEAWQQKSKPPRFSWSATAGLGIDLELRPTIAIVFGPSYRIRDF